MTTAPQLVVLDPNTIIVRDRLRKVLPQRVEAMRPDVREKGILTPIEVVETTDGPRLIYGAHRLAVVLAEVMTDIPALLYPAGAFGSEAEIRSREISENYFRFELNALERAVNIREWRLVHEALHGAAKPGRKAKTKPTDDQIDEMSANFALNFPEVVQQTLNLSRRAVYFSLKVATIEPTVLDELAEHRVANNQSELLAIAGEPPARQVLIARHLSAGADSVSAALSIIDNTPIPAPKAEWERFSEKFARFKPSEQERFFSLYEDAIVAWQAGRRN